MEDTIITFETAKLAKEKGFTQNPYKIPYSYRYEFTDNTGCVLSYSLFNPSSNICTAPSQSILAKWLREKHEIDILVQRAFSNGIKKYIVTPCFDKPVVKGYQSVEKNNYEDAYEKGLQEALRLI